ncbi:MAG: pitrilysin family protein, partial [Anaerolineae bacterium]
PGPEDIFRYELDNGIVLLVRQNDASPSVVISGHLAVGSLDESPEQAGLAAITASALSRGTANRTFDQIYEEIESVSASFGVSAGAHHTTFGGKSLAEDLPLLLDVVADVLRHPTFPAREVYKLQGELLTDLEERDHNTRRMAALTFYELAYPSNHPYSRSVSGYMETVSQLTRDDLADFYAGGYAPEGMVLVIVGAIEAQAARAYVEEALGDWSGQAYDRSPLPPAPPPTETRRAFVPIRGKSQADIWLGNPGPCRNDPTFIDAAVCNTILGVFGMMGRLGDTVRNEQGLAYYAYSRVRGGLGPGPWSVIAGVDPTNVEQAVDSIQAEIRRIRQELVPPEELADSQTFLIGSLPLRLETNEGVARAIRDIERYDLGLDYIQRYADMMLAVTPDKIRSVAQQWLDPDTYNLAIAGPPVE